MKNYKSFRYSDQFNLSEELAQAIENVINKKESSNYVCTVITCTIPEHTGKVFHSAYQENWGGPSLSGSDIAAIDKKFGHYVDENIPEKNYSYLIVMKKKIYKLFSFRLTFINKEEIEKNLESLSSVWAEYEGVFNPNIFYSKFPYMQDFFDFINEWRAENGRVTIDTDILEEGYQKVMLQNRNKPNE